MTIREHLEAIRDTHGKGLADPVSYVTYRRAVDALAILDRAERGSKTTIMRKFALVHDPERDA